MEEKECAKYMRVSRAPFKKYQLSVPLHIKILFCCETELLGVCVCHESRNISVCEYAHVGGKGVCIIIAFTSSL